MHSPERRGAHQRAHPANGMHRFKMGFAPRVVECCSVRWTLDNELARVRHQTGWSDIVESS